MAILVDGEEVDVALNTSITAIVHPGHLDITTTDRFEISPEVTVAFARGIDPGEWDKTRQAPEFLRIWGTLWKDVPPPVNIAKCSMALAHTVGLITLMIICKVEGKKIFLKMPETYLHPQQCYHLMTTILTIYPELKEN